MTYCTDNRLADFTARPIAHSPSPCSLTPRIQVCMHRQGSRATARHDAWALRAEFGGGLR